MAFGWPSYQVPEPVLSAVNARPPEPERAPTPPVMTPPTALLPQRPAVGTWILVMLFILQLALIGIVADLHVQQRNLINVLMVSMAQKKFGVPMGSVR